MEYLSYRVKDNLKLKDKSKIYFTSIKSDFEKYFDIVSKDIFESTDAIIYFKKDMDYSIEDDYLETDLSYMKLFVIPVTKDLLESDNESFDKEFQFALNKHIPVLLIAFDNDLGYRYEEKFGTLQYLPKYKQDESEIDFQNKLDKYLKELLEDHSNYDINGIRNSFTSKTFLSYRKKDRKYANELMKKIHSNREFVSTSIWFDEFLSIGEKFDVEIDEKLKKADYFILMITPNLINEENYVKNVEYPQALKEGKIIVPIVVKDTDINELNSKFPNLPPVIDVNDDKFIEKIKEVIPTSNRELTIRDRYFLAEAYLNGIDVEINLDLGLDLLDDCAESDDYYAMVASYQLSTMYEYGFATEVDFQKSFYYSKKFYELADKFEDPSGKAILMSTANLVDAYFNIGKYKEALEIANKLKEDVKVTDLTSAVVLASIYDSLTKTLARIKKYEDAIEAAKKCYEICSQIYGEKDGRSLSSIRSMAQCYQELKQYDKALEVYNQLVPAYMESYGIQSQEFLAVYLDYANLEKDMGNYQEAYSACARALPEIVKLHGEVSVGVVSCLTILGEVYIGSGDYEQAETSLLGALKILDMLKGDREMLINVYFSLTKLYMDIKDHEKVLKYSRLLADTCLELHGPEYPMSVELCVAYARMNPPDTHREEALKYLDLVFDYMVLVGKNTLITAGTIYTVLGEEKKAQELLRRYVKAHPNPDEIMD